ncbi:hypothetical protein ACFQS1_11000 [Paractinoplanes rhizophilus]|jgi:hypothetical protein|uniref:Secreted protein n=1 Tax=Paractinoplanes rhizophilus TaxID=1416877 RepID=A0ABW2HMU4_9ACTN|nr:hypothetical protein [Actinoplanes sp.]
MIARRIATLVTTLLTFAGLGACGSATTLEPRRNEPAAIALSPVGGARTTVRESHAGQAATGVNHLPSAFRLPPGSQVTTLRDHESGASFTLTAPDPEAVLAFYRRELPRRAFTIVSDRAGPDTTSLAFRNADGWAGEIYATPRWVTVAVRHA